MRAKYLLAGMVLGVALVAVGALTFIKLGGMPVATRGNPLPMERYVARTALDAAMKGETEKPSPVDASEPNLVAGAKAYRVHCAVCHGLPNQPPSVISKGMSHPPSLMPPRKGVTDDPVGETYWKARNGIRLTGMPGFEGLLSDTQLWQVSELLLNADKLPAGALAVLAPEAEAGQ